VDGIALGNTIPMLILDRALQRTPLILNLTSSVQNTIKVVAIGVMGTG
jgi:hypothetical protein